MFGGSAVGARGLARVPRVDEFGTLASDVIEPTGTWACTGIANGAWRHVLPIEWRRHPVMRSAGAPRLSGRGMLTFGLLDTAMNFRLGARRCIDPQPVTLA